MVAIKDKVLSTASSLSADELPSAESLLHELRVHQIELEMQNEELRRAQLALEESRDRYVDLFDFAPVGYVTLSEKGLIEGMNLTAASLLGRERAAMHQTRFSVLVAPEDGDDWHRFLLSMMRDGERSRRTIELHLVRGDGLWFPAQLDCVRITGDDHEANLRLALIDISVRKQAEAEQLAAVRMEYLRQLAVEEMLTEQRERHAIATDLHDGLGQTLHVARIKLETLAKGLPPETPSRALLDDLSGLLSEASRDVRALTSKLSPPALMDLGLVPALSSLAAEMERVYGLEVAVEDDGAPKPLTPSQAAILFRAVRELLINVSKHAGVGTATVKVSAAKGRLVIAVADKGRGIGDWRDTALAGKGFGLPSVHERLVFLKGAMGISSGVRGGTTVILEMPMDT